ncbi:AAA family ATPase [Streptacidiphilus sp. PAMC 29251]
MPSHLYGREDEQAAVEALLAAAAGPGRSGALVLRGEPGIGKTALLDHAAATAAGSGFRVLRTTGSSTRRSCPSPASRCCSRPPWTGCRGCPRRSGARWNVPSAWPRPAARGPATGCSRAWPCSRCWPNSPRSSRCCAWSTTPSGWTGSPPRRCCWPRGGSSTRAWCCCSPPVTGRAPGPPPVCRSCGCVPWPTRPPRPCSPRPPRSADPGGAGSWRGPWQPAGPDRAADRSRQRR